MFILPDPVGSMPEVVKELHEYGLLSGFKINDSKSEILAISPQKHWRRVLSMQYAFRWCSSSLVYLGIRLSPDIAKLFTLNFTPLLEVFKTDIARWSPKYLSWMGRISIIKMNLLPRLLYLFHTLPICIHLSFHKELRMLFSSFIWPNTRPRLKHAILCKSKRNGGLALPDTRLYYYATHLTRVIDWVTGSPEQKWLDLEEAQAGRPMWTLPWLPWSAGKNTDKELSPVGSTLAVWHKTRTKYTLSTYPSPLLPLRYNPDFPVEILQSLATRLADSPNTGVHHILRNGTFVTLEAPDRPAPTFAELFNFHQIKSFLRKLPNNNSLTRSLSSFEILCRRTSPLAHGVSTLYGLLRDLVNEPPAHMSRWERTLNTSITDEVWSSTLS
uniref:Reverse transcriptase n=1 Tax=Leptobrachium leishanense TaxID=445787 RepID=A0A8C5LRZ5_9ANUR